jgi:hypothetical protein
LVVQMDEKAKQATLQIPMNLMMQFGRPGGPGRPGFPPGGGVPPGRQGADAGHIGTPTIIAGLALTLAFATGGLWMVRRGGGRYFALVLAVSLSVAGTAALWANAAPPPAPKPPVPPGRQALPNVPLPADLRLTGDILFEMVPNGKQVTLIVPKTMIAKKGFVPPQKDQKDKTSK